MPDGDQGPPPGLKASLISAQHRVWHRERAMEGQARAGHARDVPRVGEGVHRTGPKPPPRQWRHALPDDGGRAPVGIVTWHKRQDGRRVPAVQAPPGWGRLVLSAHAVRYELVVDARGLVWPQAEHAEGVAAVPIEAGRRAAAYGPP